jgi:hypothetical protein
MHRLKCCPLVSVLKVLCVENSFKKWKDRVNRFEKQT